MTITVALVENKTSGVGKTLQTEWSKLSNRLARCDIGKKEGRGWMPAVIDPGPRTGDRVKAVSLLALDVEAKSEAVLGDDGKELHDKHGDIVKAVTGAEPPDVRAMLAEVELGGWRCILHTTYSHTAEHPRYRLMFDIDRPLAAAEVKPLGLHLAALLGIGACVDTSCLEPARLFYLPRCPADRASLFHHGETRGAALPVDELLADAERTNEARKSAVATRRTGELGNVVQAFNGAHDVGTILEQHGYRSRDRRRWLWPGSTTGMPGVRLLPDSKPERVYSSHAGDPLNDGHAHDAFDLFRILEHGGDLTAAVKRAARVCGMHSRVILPAISSVPARGGRQANAERLLAVEPPMPRTPASATPATKAGETDEQTIERLAVLPLLEYDRARKAAAKALGIRPDTLDKIISDRRGTTDTGGMEFDEVELWPDEVDAGELLSEISATVRRFIVCERETADTVALWAAMTWFMDVVQVAPLAVITSPEKRCGKSLLLFLLAKLAYRPMVASNISPAAMYRAIDAWNPTLLVDETDAFMRENEELRGIVNAGHTRNSAYVVRTVGDDFTPKRFSVWGAKALAGIGHLADTLMDRAIVLELRRKLPHETVERLRHVQAELFQDQAAKLARFAHDSRDAVRQATPVLHESLNDRQQDNWEPLLAIAATAGGDWINRAQNAALKLSNAVEFAHGLGNELLTDIQTVFNSKKVDKTSTAALI